MEEQLELQFEHTGDLMSIVLGKRVARQLAKMPVAGDLRTTSVGELTNVYGLSVQAVRKTMAFFELVRRVGGERMRRGEPLRGGADVFRHAAALGLPDLQVEQFHALLLDGKHRLIDDILVSQGTLTSSPVHPREVFHAAIRSKAAAVVLVHNHPSGDPSPSADDLEITRRLCDVGDVVGIRVVDHVIVGNGAFTSMADRGLMR